MCRDVSDRRRRRPEEARSEEAGRRGALRSLRFHMREEEHAVLPQAPTQGGGRERGVRVQRVRLQDREEVVAVLSHQAEAQGAAVLRRRRAAGTVLLQPVRLQEQEQVRAEDTRRAQAHGRLQVLLRDLRQEVQGQGRPDEPHTVQSPGAAGDLRRLRQDLPQQQLPVRASEVRPLQGQVRVPDMQEADGQSGEPQRAHAQAARAQGERGVRGVRQDVLAEQQAEGTHEDPHRGQAVQLYHLQEVLRPQNGPQAAPAHPHGHQAVRVRYLRQGLHSEAGPD